MTRRRPIYNPFLRACFRLVVLLALGSHAIPGSTQPFPTKKGGLIFRIQNNPALTKLHQVDSLFSTYDQKFCLAVTSWIFPLAPEYVDSLILFGERGYEVMDHTPSFQTQYINLLNPADTSLFTGKPGVDHVTAGKVCLAYSSVDTSVSHNEGLVNVTGNRVVSHDAGEFGNLTGNPYFFALYLNTVNKVCLWYDLSAVNPGDPDTLFVKSFWDEPVNFGNLPNLHYHKLTQVNVMMQPEAIRLLGQRSLFLFDQHDIPRPVTWIHPSGQMPMLDGYQVKANMGDSLGYSAGSNFVNKSYLCYNENNPYGIRQFGMQNESLSLTNHTFAWNAGRLANAVAKHYVSIDISTLEGAFGGWNSFLVRLDSLLHWCEQKDVPIGTYSQWKTWLYDSVPIRVINIFPELQTDRDGNNYPDGYDQGDPVTSQYDTTDGVAISGGRSFVLTEAGTLCKITQLAGLEKGDNYFSLWTKNTGPDSSLLKATFSFPGTGDTQELSFTADTGIWTKQTGTIDVPASATLMNVVITRTDTMPDTLKISGMRFYSAGFLKRSAYPQQTVHRNEQFDRIDLHNLVIDTIYNPTTITWWVKGADTMSFRDLTSQMMLPLKPGSFWIGSDHAWLMAQSTDGRTDSCWLSFTSLPLDGDCPGTPITITLLDTLENDFIQWTSIPFDSTLTDPHIYNPTANPGVTTLYKVTAIDPLGPTKYDSLLVVRFPVPDPSLPPDTTICQGDSVTLTVSGGGHYLWNTGDTTASILVYPAVTTTYSVMVTNEYGCYDSAATQVLVNPAPYVRIFGLWPAYCVYDYSSTVFVEPEGGTLAGPGLEGDIFYPDRANLGLNLIIYRYADSTGCSNTDTAKVYVYPRPYVLPQPKDTLVCADKTITLRAGPGNASYLWSNGVSDSIVTVDTSGIGLGLYNIWVYVTKEGCVDMDTASIHFIQCPIGWEDPTREDPFRIYPNPAAETVTIEWLTHPGPGFVIDLLDLSGRVLKSKEGTGLITRVELSDIPSGLYLVRITGSAAVYRFRLVRQ